MTLLSSDAWVRPLGLSEQTSQTFSVQTNLLSSSLLAGKKIFTHSGDFSFRRISFLQSAAQLHCPIVSQNEPWARQLQGQLFSTVGSVDKKRLHLTPPPSLKASCRVPSCSRRALHTALCGCNWGLCAVLNIHSRCRLRFPNDERELWGETLRADIKTYKALFTANSHWHCSSLRTCLCELDARMKLLSLRCYPTWELAGMDRTYSERTSWMYRFKAEELNMTAHLHSRENFATCIKKNGCRWWESPATTNTAVKSSST